MFLVGLTGGIATGKTTVSKFFNAFGCVVIDADQIAREVVEPNKPAWFKLRSMFGVEIFDNETGELDRDKLGEIIFSDPSKRKLLNSITHPEIFKSMVWKIIKNLLTGSQFVILDVPLLVESGRFLPYLSYICVVTCNQEQQLERLMKRNNLEKDQAIKRINSQLPLSKKIKHASHIIDNSNSLEQTAFQIDAIVTEFRRSRKHWRPRLICLAIIVGIVALFSGCTALGKILFSNL